MGKAGEVCLNLSLELRRVVGKLYSYPCYSFFTLQHYFVWPDYCYIEKIQGTGISLKYSIPVRWLFNISFLSCVCGEGVRVGVDAGTGAHVCTAHTHTHAYTCMALCMEARDGQLISCLYPSPLLFLTQSLSLCSGLTSSSGQQALGIILSQPLQHRHC